MIRHPSSIHQQLPAIIGLETLVDMKKITIFAFLLSNLIYLFIPSKAYALDLCAGMNISLSASPNPLLLRESRTVTITLQGGWGVLNETAEYSVAFKGALVDTFKTNYQRMGPDGTITWTRNIPITDLNDDFILKLQRKTEFTGLFDEEICQGDTLKTTKNPADIPDYSCNISISPDELDVGTSFTYQITGLPPETDIAISFDIPGITREDLEWGTSNSQGTYSREHVPINVTGLTNISVQQRWTTKVLCRSQLFVCEKLPCKDNPLKEELVKDFEICKRTIAAPIGEENSKTSKYYEQCRECIDQSGIWTAIGCINFNPKQLVEGILTTAVGIGGGFALLLMLYGAFIINTSAGNPERVQQGKDRFTAAIIGLLLIIFSVVILRIIGVDILRIPGL
jgi:hypothetical protein